MRLPWESTKPLRVEVALNPATAAPIWTDVSSLVTGEGVHIVRGGGGRHEMAPPGRCSFTLDNRDGAFSDLSGAALALYRKRVRVSYRTPGDGNTLSPESASFEGATVGSWTAGPNTTLATSTAHPQVGTRGMLITWGTGAGGAFPPASLPLTDIVVGRTYTASAYVWVPVGHPPVQLLTSAGDVGSASTVFGSMQRISLTWVATAGALTSGAITLRIGPVTTPTAGQQCYVDAVQVDEGSSVRPFTTTPPAVSYRFTGRIATNDLTFPALGYALTTLNATDETAWQGSTFSTLRPVPVQEILSDSPAGLWTVADGDLGDVSGNGGGALTIMDSGTAPTSGAPIASSTTATGLTFAGGQYLAAQLAFQVGESPSEGFVYEAAVRTAAVTEGAVVTAANGYGPTMVVSVDADGKPRARRWHPFRPGSYDVNTVSSVAINDGQAHHLAVRWTSATGTLDLFVDGVLRGTNSGTPGGSMPHDRIYVGGTTQMANFNGLVAHVAVTEPTLSDARIAAHADALLNAFNGETIAARMARYNRWAGTPFGVVMPMSTVANIGHFDTEGKSVADAIAAASVVEDGMTFVRGDGQLIIRGRTLFTQPTTTVTLPGPGAGQASRLRQGLTYTSDPRIVVNDMTGTMPGGITDRVVHSASIAEYGRSSDTVDGPFASATDLSSVIEWRVNTEATPRPQLDGLSVRMSQLDDATTTTLLSVDLGHVIGWTGMPAQAPASASTGVVIGIEETYTVNDLLWTASVAPNYGANVMLADDPNAGKADSGFIAAY